MRIQDKMVFKLYTKVNALNPHTGEYKKIEARPDSVIPVSHEVQAPLHVFSHKRTYQVATGMYWKKLKELIPYQYTYNNKNIFLAREKGTKIYKMWMERVSNTGSLWQAIRSNSFTTDIDSIYNMLDEGVTYEIVTLTVLEALYFYHNRKKLV